MIHHRLRGIQQIGGGYSYRQWRLLANDISWSGGPYYFQAIYEFQFFESPDATGTNINIGGTASASSQYATSGQYSAAAANDGNLEIYWQTLLPFSVNATPQWWAIDYGIGQQKQVRSIKMYLWPGGAAYHAKSYKLQYLIDGLMWYDLTIINTTEADTIQTFTSLQ